MNIEKPILSKIKYLLEHALPMAIPIERMIKHECFVILWKRQTRNDIISTTRIKKDFEIKLS